MCTLTKIVSIMDSIIPCNKLWLHYFECVIYLVILFNPFLSNRNALAEIHIH